jgi:hypothetical protein
MTTTELIDQVGIAIAALLILAGLTVILLRLVSLPLATASLALDAAANGIGRALQIPAPPAREGGGRR